MVIAMLFLFWVEVGGYIDGVIDHQFSIDDEIEKSLFIHLDMVIAMPCNYIHANVLDVTEDRTMAAELLNYVGVNFPQTIPTSYTLNGERKYKTPELEEVLQESLLAQYSNKNLHVNEGAPLCHIFGSFPVTKVEGDFHFTGKGYGYRDRSTIPVEALNFTHIINEFSYGSFYPYMVNPLDATAKVTRENLQSYQYFMSIVPTVYKKLGIEIHTNQYALTQQARVYQYAKGIPGIFFKYDFEPILMRVEESRIPFIQFVVKLTTILGGIMVITSWFYRGTDKLIALIFGQKYAELGQEKVSSVLDRNYDD